MLQRMISWQREFPKNYLVKTSPKKMPLVPFTLKETNGITLYILVSQDFLQTVTTQKHIFTTKPHQKYFSKQSKKKKEF